MDKTNMETEKLNNTLLFNELFVWVDESLKHGDIKERIFNNFIEKTPESVKKMLIAQGIRIYFYPQSHFEVNESSITCGYYNINDKYIAVSYNRAYTEIISTMHHEIGHAVDFYIGNMYFFNDDRFNSMGAGSGTVVMDITKEEGWIFESSYYRSTPREFFAQSYCDYVLGRDNICNNLKIKKLIDFTLSRLELFYSSLTVDEIFEHRESDYPIYFLDENRFISKKTNLVDPETVDIILHQLGKKSKVLFKQLNYATIFRNGLCDKEFIISTGSSAEGDFKVNSYMLTPTKTLNLGGYVTDYLNSEEVKYHYYPLKKSNGKIDILYKRGNKLFSKAYQFNRYQHIRSNDKFIGYGERDNSVVLLNSEFNPTYILPGKLITTISPGIVTPNNVNGDSILFLVDDTDKGCNFLYNDNGKCLESYDVAKEVFVPISCFEEAIDPDSELYRCYFEDYDIPFEEAILRCLFLKNKELSLLISLETNLSLTLPDTDDIDLCEVIDLYSLTEGAIYTCIDNYAPLKIKRNNTWHLGHDLHLCEHTIDTDDVFITDDFNGEAFYIGVNYKDKNNRTLDQEGIISAEIISIYGDAHIKNLTYNDLLVFLQHLAD